MIIQEIVNKCKSDEVYIALVVIFVGIGAFGLGRLSKIESARQGVTIEAPAAVVEALVAENSVSNLASGPSNTDFSPVSDSSKTGGQVVASKTGTKYHFPWCAGARTISEANKITFNSAEEARASGYTPASNCKGLK